MRTLLEYLIAAFWLWRSKADRPLTANFCHWLECRKVADSGLSD